MIGSHSDTAFDQGKVLERGAVDLAVVTSIVGIARFEIVFRGEAGHAGTTLLSERKDALVAAAATIMAVRAEAEQQAAIEGGSFMATTGLIACEPNAPNVVLRLARLVIDARSATISGSATCLLRLSIAQARGRPRRVASSASASRRWSRSTPVACDETLRYRLAKAAAELDLSTIDTVSGAGHDAAFLATVAPMAVLFVPSRDRRSHCPEEWTECDQMTAGAATLYQTVRCIHANYHPELGQ